MPPIIPATVDCSHPTQNMAHVYTQLAHLQDLYPAFEQWFWKKVVPEIGVARRVFVADRDGKIEGIVIAKRTAAERKLCTVWVASQYRGRAVGARLMTHAMEWMNCERPLISVPSSRMLEFRTFFRDRGFVENERLPGYYRAGETEHVFNGSLAIRR